MGVCTKAFVVSTGRCGTTLLGIALNEAAGTLALNEGQVRGADLRGGQVLRALTLENYAAYAEPGRAADILRERRAGAVEELAAGRGLTHFVEIAYYLCPFTAALAEVFPDARLLFLHRDGRDFVRSVYVGENPDPMPVGYLDPRPLSPVERFVAMGRLRPRPGSPEEAGWADLLPFEKNVWLWAETNGLVLDQLAAWPAERVLALPMRELLTPDGLLEAAAFLGPALDPGRVRELLGERINTRSLRLVPDWRQWDDALKARFKRLGQDMLERLGYAGDAGW